MDQPLPLKIGKFGAVEDPLVQLSRSEGSRQAKYLRCYLHDLGARSVMIEPNYFDRDYLSEFEAFYARSTTGYPNRCRRAHYFSAVITRDLLRKAVGGDRATREVIERSYLGHVVLRPIPGAPIGHTVLRLYPDDAGIAAGTPRVMQPAREYVSHVAGLMLKVSGIAWQQQDTAVGSCATVALRSMLHSSAFDDHHAIPTTAAITSMAHRAAPTGKRIFPDSGLQFSQVLEVVKGHGLAPASYHCIEPTEIAVAVHSELRTEPLALQRAAVEDTQWLPLTLADELRRAERDGETGMPVSSRFIRLHDYLDRELGCTLRVLGEGALSHARLAMWETVAPMSYHVGSARVSLGKEPMMDILFDTSDSDRHLQPKAHVAFHPEVPWLLKCSNRRLGEKLELGMLVRAW